MAERDVLRAYVVVQVIEDQIAKGNLYEIKQILTI